jgi:hypothetical protein
MLIDLGAIVQGGDKYGCTVLHFAAANRCQSRCPGQGQKRDIGIALCGSGEGSDVEAVGSYMPGIEAGEEE